MSKYSQQINNYVIAPLIIAITGILKLPDWSDAIKAYSVNLFNSLGAVSFFGTIYIYYFSILSPYRKYQKLQNRKYEVIEDLVTSLNEEYKNQFNFSVNIMFVHNGYFVKREPLPDNDTKKKLQYRERVFKVIREFGDNVHKDLKFTINQGVCGEAFRNAEKSKRIDIVGNVVGGEFQDGKSMNFTKQQKDLTKDLIIVISCPLIIKEGEGDNEVKKVIGVLNVHSKEINSVVLLTDVQNAKDLLYKRVALLSKVFVKLHV